MIDPGDLLEPVDHSGDPDADPAAPDPRRGGVDPDHREPGQEAARGLIERIADAVPNVDR